MTDVISGGITSGPSTWTKGAKRCKHKGCPNDDNGDGYCGEHFHREPIMGVVFGIWGFCAIATIIVLILVILEL